MTTKQLIVRIVVVFSVLSALAIAFSVYEVHHLTGMY